MGQIKILDSVLSNKIAAGEVVERPASVVKEIVENSLDAGASQIIIKIKEAGRKEIMVSDNGSGMDKDDARLAFARHATSKIKNDRDLFRIATLGFRGEALASIASVSDIDLDTARENEIGSHVELRHGEIVNLTPIGINKGTTIYVRNLFYNTPARLKFLKSDNVEFSHISDVIMKLALAYPDVSFTLYNEDKISFYSSGRGNVLEIISSLYGLEVAKNMNRFEREDDDFSIHGYTSNLSINRGNKNAIITILNGRCIRLIAGVNAIIESYRNYLPSDKYPITILDIKVDPSLVDVNVHPSKQEVRLSKENELKELIFEAIRDVFMVKDISPSLTMPKSLKEESGKQIQLNLDETQIRPVYNSVFPTLKVNEDLINEKSEIYKESEETLKRKRLNVIGQYISKYILASDGDNFYIVDQHAAAERINFEKFQKQFNDISRWNYMDLLVPVVVNLTRKEAALIEDNINIFSDLGIKIEPFGDSSFRVSSIPTWMKEVDINKYVNDAIEQVLNDNKKINLLDLRYRVIATMACKASLRANTVLSMIEMQTLLDNLLKCDDPYTCAHGRPSIISYSTYELDKMFKRVG